MATEQDRDRIVERIRLEMEVRDELSKTKPEESKSVWSWAQSKLGLLIIGAVMTGVLVPLFQTTQETIRWTRQNRYDVLKYRLESARSSMKALAQTHAFVAEAFQRAQAFGPGTEDAENLRAAYRQQSLEMQNRRFQQNAKFVGAVGLLDETDRDLIIGAFNTYLSSVQQLLHVLDSISDIKNDSSSANNEKQTGGSQKIMHSLIDDINTNYDRILSLLKGYLRRLEKEGEKYY